MSDREERDGREQGAEPEDLFEDLDRFFAPIQDEDWPEPEEGGDRDDAAARRERPEGPPPADVEPRPTGALPEEPEPEEAVAPKASVEEAGAEPAAAQPPADEAVWGEPTGELTSEEWTRLRDVLGEEEGEEEPFEFEVGGRPSAEETLFGFETAEPPAPTEPAGHGAEPSDEERREVTLEDLRTAPPEYEGLPPPPEEGTAGVVEPAAEPSREEPAGGEEPYPAEEPYPGQEPYPTEEPPPFEEPYPAEQPDVGPEAGFPFGEPLAAPASDRELADVEAAADRLAEDFRAGPEEAAGTVEEDLLAEVYTPPSRTIKVGEPESMMGPTWEEPGSRPITAEASAPRPSRDLPAAVLSAVVLAGVALVSLAVSAAAFAVVAGAIVLLGQAELYATMHRRGHQPATALGLVVGAFVLAGAYMKGEASLPFFIAVGLVATVLWYMAAAPKSRSGTLANIGATMLGILYVPVLAGYMLIILSQANSGRALMLSVLALTLLYDISAFGVGSLWGSRPLAPTISPKKSWEGLLGATFVTILIAIAALPSVDPIGTVTRAVGMALVVVVFAPLGDLAESALKRDLGVKDMGSILPGHGGVLDRVDSLLFVAPAAFYFLRLVF